MTRDRDQQPRRAASADDAFLEVTGALARNEGARARDAAAGGGDEEDRAAPGAAAGAPSRDRTARPWTPPEDSEEAAEGAHDATEPAVSPEEVRDHLRRRAIFLRELAEARELRRRVTPHRSRRARIHAALRRRTFRIN
ncbi:hypothetical protein [Actinomadura rugatobispora]|uniref:Uncharacterized protein n=1 Tax=Actinomadura rugatobispora TaxID=1994 RepID=A0ABW0ZR57_9ACTN|nr:hypothetical protein GCM10010200_044180 [Actinomadura rugatobispora]